MTERSYAIRYRVGDEIYLHAQKTWATLESATRALARLSSSREQCVVVIDAADLPTVAADEYQHAESRMLFWAERCQRLRPSAPLPSVEWRQLTVGDVDALRRAYAGWQLVRTFPQLADRDEFIEKLDEVLRHVIERLTAVPR